MTDYTASALQAFRRYRSKPGWWRDRTARAGPAPLVLTATIQPPKDIRQIIRTSPVDRLEDYKRALRFYLELSSQIVDRIVFVENSLSPLDELRALVAESGRDKQVEFISFWGLDYPSEYNRGYGEFKLLDYAVENSRVLASLKPDDLFWKSTGRYIVKNFTKVVRSCPARASIYLDIRPSRRFVDVRCFASTVPAYCRYLLNTYPQMTKIRTETVLFEHLSPSFSDDGFVGAMNTIPTFDAIAANKNQPYHAGIEWWTHRFRVLSRALCPSLWY